MALIVDKNSNPMPQTANGEADKDVFDVRAIPTGTLIYNLIRYTGEEVGLENMEHQLQAMKEQQKLVADPPQMVAIRARLQEIKERRYIIAKDINDRFADLDAAYRQKCGIEILMPNPATDVDPKPKTTD